MFGNLKKKLSTAIQEGLIITENLQQQVRQRVNSPTTAAAAAVTTTKPTKPTTTTVTSNFLEDNLISSHQSSSSSLLSNSDLILSPQINVTAGCNLLAKYEDDWKLINENNDINGQKAAEAAAHIDFIEKRLLQQQFVMNDLINCLSGLPALIQEIKTSTETLNEIMALSEKAEIELDHLENLCEECDLQEFMLQKQFELAQHKQKKLLDLENYRQKLAAEQHKKMQQQEERFRQIQRERQAVFDDAFRCDLEEYKQTGHVQKIHKEVTKDATQLEDVILEDNDTKDALEEFLSS